jgi:antirestriction protein
MEDIMKAEPTEPSVVSQEPGLCDPAAQANPPGQPPTRVAHPSDTPRIYVASLADYNAGELHGCWIDADQDADTIHAEIAAMLAQSREPMAEEWAIHDYENFDGLRLSEFADIATVAEAARLIVEHGPVFGHLMSNFGGLSGLEEAQQFMQDGYHGAFDRIEEYVEEFLDDCYGDALAQLPDFIRYHIDYEGIARDLEYGGDIFTIECAGRVHVFDANL